MKLWKTCRAFLKRYGALLSWLMAGLCALVLIAGYLFPKYAYDITNYHVILEDGESEWEIPLTSDTLVSYSLDVHENRINGIQPCFDWGSEAYPAGDIVIEAWHEEDFPSEQSYIGAARMKMNTGLQRAYTYAEISNSEELTGKLLFTIRYEGEEAEGENPPMLIATDREMEDSGISVNGETMNGDLLMYYASIKKTYPMIFDSRILLFVFLAMGAFMSGNRLAEKTAGEERAKNGE